MFDYKIVRFYEISFSLSNQLQFPNYTTEERLGLGCWGLIFGMLVGLHIYILRGVYLDWVACIRGAY